MASTIWKFGVEGSGLYFEIEWDGVSSSVEITMIEGSMDLNALWWSDGDDASEGSVSLTSKQSSLNMNGSGSIDPDGNAVTWDQVSILSSTGLGKAGTSKSTYLTAGESYSISIPSGSWASSIEDLTIGVRATSVSGLADGSSSLKLVAVGEAGEVPTQRIFVIGEGAPGFNGYFDSNEDGKLGAADLSATATFGADGNVDLAAAATIVEFVGAGPYMSSIDLSGFGEEDSIIVNFSQAWAATSLSATLYGIPAIPFAQRGYISVTQAGFEGYTYSNYTERVSIPSLPFRYQYFESGSFYSPNFKALGVGVKFTATQGRGMLIGAYLNYTAEGSGGVIPGFNSYFTQYKTLASWNLNSTTINPNQLSVVWPGNYVPN